MPYDSVVKRSPIGTPNGLAHGTIPPSNWPWPPWPPVIPGQTTRFTAFWTRLCSACERIEQDNFETAIANFTAGPAAVIAAGQWEQPLNTCTCLKQIGWQRNLTALPPDAAAPPVGPPIVGAVPGNCLHPPTGNYTGGPPPRLCVDCHFNTYEQLRATRDLNDDWLRTTSRSADGKLCIASTATKNRRDAPASSSHRACRCGGDVDVPPHQAEVLLCMACSGLRCLIRKTAPLSRNSGTIVRARRTLANKPPLASQSRGIGDMSLGRVRNQFSDTHTQ